MTRRQPTEQRSHQIASAVLDLLATESIDSIGTRRIAQEVGISQPGLFRHFRGRDALLRAAVELAREELSSRVEEALDEPTPPRQLRALTRAVLEQAKRRPGLPRLFHARRDDGELGRALLGLAAMVRGLVGEVVRSGQREGAFRDDHPADVSAFAVVAVLQAAAASPTDVAGREAVDLTLRWLEGAPASRRQSSAPAPTPTSSPSLPAVLPRGTRPRIDTLDVRPALARGEEPFASIIDAIERLPPRGVLEVQAPFRPTPLLSVLRRRGLDVWHRAVSPDHHVLLIRGEGEGPVDLTARPVPEPLEHALRAARALQPGASWLGRTPHPPVHLRTQLVMDGLGVATHREPEGTGLVLVWRDR